MRLRTAAINALVLLLVQPAVGQQLQTDTTFSYQGRLTDAGLPANDKYDFTFSIYKQAEGGAVVGTPVTQNLQVTDGLFSTELDFGASTISGEEVYIEIAVTAPGGVTTVLSPRQRIRPVPQAIQAAGATANGGKVIFQRLEAAGSNQVLFNNPTTTIKFGANSNYWQSFQLDYEAVIDGFDIWCLPNGSLGSPPNWQIREGAGPNGARVAEGRSEWTSPASSSAQYLICRASTAEYPLDANTVYSITFDSNVIGFSYGNITDPNSGESSNGANLAARYKVYVRDEGKPGAYVDRYGNYYGSKALFGVAGDSLRSGSLGVIGDQPSFYVADTDPTDPFSADEIRMSAGFWPGGEGFNETARWTGLFSEDQFSLNHQRFDTSSFFPLFTLERDPALRAGLFEPSPLVQLHVTGNERNLSATALHPNEIVVLESGDSGLGLYSDGSGTFGSFISMGEIDAAGNLVDKWSIGRRTSGFNIELQFAYGTDPTYSNNLIRFALRPNGSAWLQGALQQNSAADQKHDIRTLQNAIDTLLRLRGVSYTWNETGEPDIGFLADEMAEVLPEIVGFDENHKPIGIDYGRVTALIVEATKDQERRLTEQDRLIRELLGRVEALEADRGD